MRPGGGHWLVPFVPLIEGAVIGTMQRPEDFNCVWQWLGPSYEGLWLCLDIAGILELDSCLQNRTKYV